MKTALSALAVISVTTLASAVTSGNVIVIDSFGSGSNFTISDSSGTAKFNAVSGETEILGGNRQLRVRAGGSGYYGSSNLTVNVAAGTVASFGGDTGDRSLQYGSAIGADTFTGVGPGVPVNLNLNLNLGDAFEIDVVSKHATESGLRVLVRINGNFYYSPDLTLTGTGTHSFFLNEFAGLTESLVKDIDGFVLMLPSKGDSVGDGLVVSEFRIVTSAIPEPSSYAAFAGLGVLAMAATRRRRAS